MTMAHARESFAGRLPCSGEGKLLRFEGDKYFLKNREDGKEVRLHVEKATIKDAVGLTEGDNIIAEITDQNHVVVILTDQSQSTILRDRVIKDLNESR